jgi:hypothetical protein
MFAVAVLTVGCLQMAAATLQTSGKHMLFGLAIIAVFAVRTTHQIREWRCNFCSLVDIFIYFIVDFVILSSISQMVNKRHQRLRLLS